MKHLKKNFKELWLDAKTVVLSSVSLVVDVVSIPVSACKDIRDGYIVAKAKMIVQNEERKAKKAEESEVIQDASMQGA